MSDVVPTTSDGLCKLVRWAHSHGTICNLIPSAQHLARGSHVNALTPEPGPHGSAVPVVIWGCGAGHAYHWPLGDHSADGGGGSANSSQAQERFVGGRPSNKVAARTSCDPSCSEAASGGEEFSRRLQDTAGCDSSATDDDSDYEPRPARKRGGATRGAVAARRVKQEATSAEEYDAVAQPQRGHSLGCEGSVDPEVEQAERCSSATETTGGLSELQKLQALLSAERSRNQHMTEMIYSLKQDKELLQQELTKKAELICDFLQDKLRPEKSWPRCSNQMDPGSSHMTSSEDVVGFDSPTLFDSLDEMELHPLEHHRTLKSKRSREGENTRVRMKNVVGVIARYMAALQEFRRSVSMKVAFDRVGVDRNTISRTAAIAELSLAAPEVFQALAPWDEKEETLANYTHRCRQAMDDAIKAKIKTMKAKGELLPIVSK
ncbi:coiled-coil domain-containing protein 106 isoform X2 [Scophthalmus maximus]|uniref:coiled-coil domain-containing protein 106 isoform X2 n=1 Tax=Scophthalmus maximus TaxID=52904 RepID=UPI001FA8DD62|nr:coiled-coil domain-containing protein 106 isoform X2 [Scophthalmus maximus]